MAENINRCVFSGNLTKDPELREFGSGGKVANLRLAVNSRVKKNDEWVDKPNYLDIAVFGRQGENAAQYLKKGSPVMVDCRVDWREWETDGGDKRQAVSFIADNVQFLASRSDEPRTPSETAAADVPASADDFAPTTVPADDDIPF